jgi:hypothetical protein
MIKFLLVLVLAIFAISASAAEVPADFLHAINMVEGSGKRSNVKPGDNGKAIGPFQIHKAYWQDAVEHRKIGGKYEDCQNYEYSVKVVNAYMNRYAFYYIKSGNYEAMARIHNGGPKGYAKSSTLEYWQKVEKFL